MRSWALGHHAGIVTYPHHDADGAGTFAIVTSGVKNWVVMRPKHSRKALPHFLARLSTSTSRLPDFSHSMEAETIHLHPGDLL